MTDKRSTATRWLAVVGVAILSCALWVALRQAYVPAFGLPTFLGACNRIKESGLPLLPTDQICFRSFWVAFRLNLSWASLIQVSGYWVASVLLVVSGRRWSALLPPLAMVIADASLFMAGRGDSYPPQWQQGFWVWTAGAFLVLLPVVVAISIVPRVPKVRVSARWFAWLLGAVVLATATFALGWLFLGLHAPSLGAVRFWIEGWGWYGWLLSAGTAASMVLFGVLLGRARGLWPWSFAVVAVLLSGGPTVLLTRPIESPGQPRTTVYFGVVVPLFILGLLWSRYQDLVCRLDRRCWRDDLAFAVPDTRRVRPVVLNGIAVGLVVASVIAFRGDPYSHELPNTYIGSRNTANDVATRMNLADGLAAMNTYRKEHGTYDGFRAADGAAIDPIVPWIDVAAFRSLNSDGWATGVAAIPDGRHETRLVAMAPMETAWCLHSVDGRVSFGRSEGPTSTPSGSEMISSALRNCDDERWTDPALDAPPYPECDPADSYLICRMVTVLMYKIVNRTEAPTTFVYAFGDRWRTDVPVRWHVSEQADAGHQQVTFWSGKGGRLLSVTITDLGHAKHVRGGSAYSSGSFSGAPVDLASALLSVDVAYSWRAVMGGRAYRFTVHTSSNVNSARRQELASVVRIGLLDA